MINYSNTQHGHCPVIISHLWSYTLFSEQARITYFTLTPFRLPTCCHNQTLEPDENESEGPFFLMTYCAERPLLFSFP